MQLKKVIIKNFRSIAYVTLNFKPTCRVLVGINESGKSNILKALSLLDPDTTPSIDDIRDSQPDEEIDEDAYVRFFFSVDAEENSAAYKRLEPKILAKDSNSSILTVYNKTFSFKEFCESRNETQYVVNVKSGKKYFSYWALGSARLIGDWKKPSDTCPDDAYIQKGEKQIPINTFALILHTDYPDIESSYLTNVSTEEINKLVNKEIHSEIEDLLPSCVFWSYNDSNLLPGQVAIAEFASNPDICLPLKQMFNLAGISDIAGQIAIYQKKANGLKNLLTKVSKLCTDHMHSVWKDYQQIQFSLVPNGTYIDATIKDAHNDYNLDRRSDGFKRFITFLLLVSAKVKTNELENILYLHDEPEVSLHPSGVRYLRDELIKISKTNYVVYSTHSIFMIDKEMPERHLIVTKDSEITSIKEVNVSEVIDEEVIYNALGFSWLETLRENNILFEGWRDKKLFQIALSKGPSEFRDCKIQLLRVGLCHAQGVKDMTRLSQLLELANRKCLIITDSDKPAKEKQKEHKNNHSYGEWFRYDELLSGDLVMTAEDFIKPEAFIPIIKKMRTANPNLHELKIEALSVNCDRLQVIHHWLDSSGVPREEIKPILHQFKTDLFESLKQSQIETKYYDLLTTLCQHL